MKIASFDPSIVPFFVKNSQFFSVAFYDIDEHISSVENLAKRLSSSPAIQGYNFIKVIERYIERESSQIVLIPGDYFIVAIPDMSILQRYVITEQRSGFYTKPEIVVDPFGEILAAYRAESKMIDVSTIEPDVDISDFFNNISTPVATV